LFNGDAGHAIMPVLKHESSASASAVKDAIVLDMGDLRKQADQLRHVAQAQAQRIVEDAKRHASEIAEQARVLATEQGYTEGHDRGLAEGREQGHTEALTENRTQLEQLRNTWQASFEQWDAQRQAMETDAKHALLRLGLLFGEKIVHRVIEVDQTVVVHQLAEALSYVLKPTDVIVRINPADRPLIDEALPQLLAGLSHLDRVRVDEDVAISIGGCIIDFGKGRIDSTIEKQLERLAQVILPQSGGVDRTD